MPQHRRGTTSRPGFSRSSPTSSAIWPASRSIFPRSTVDLGGIDDFRQKLYAALRGIGFGRTVTYGELAKQIGLTGWEGARDVGEAMGKNPVPIVIPCHRVLAAGNKPGGFSAYGGVTTKQKLLALEGVRLGEAPDAPPRLPGL